MNRKKKPVKVVVKPHYSDGKSLSDTFEEVICKELATKPKPPQKPEKLN